MKATKKIVGAACALVAAVALSAGSTFAWFAENGKVTATGLEVDVSTSNAYLIIAQTTAGLADNETELTMNPTGNGGKLKPSAYIAADYNASTDTNKAETDTWTATTLGNDDTTFIGNSSQWYTGMGTDANNGDLKGNKVAISGDDISDYVIMQDIVISISGTTPVTNVKAIMTAEITEAAKACPIKIVFLYQSVEGTAQGETPTYGSLATWEKVEVDANDGLGTSGVDLGGIATPNDYIAVKVLVYMDGNDGDVKTANSGNLSGCSISFEFKDAEATTVTP